MAQWAQYNGHKFVPHVVGRYQETSWIVKINGLEHHRCCSEEVAQADVKAYQERYCEPGEVATYEKVVTSCNIIEDY